MSHFNGDTWEQPNRLVITMALQAIPQWLTMFPNSPNAAANQAELIDKWGAVFAYALANAYHPMESSTE